MRAGDAPSADELRGGIGMDPAATVGRHVLEERVAHEPVPEPVAGRGRLDHPCGQRPLEVVVGLGVVETGQGDELVGVEGGADDGDPLQDVAGGRLDPGDHRDLEEVHPGRLDGGPPGHLGDGERDAAGKRRDPLDERSVGRRHVPLDQRAASARRRTGTSASSVAPWRVSRLVRVSSSAVGSGAPRWASSRNTWSLIVDRAR